MTITQTQRLDKEIIGDFFLEEENYTLKIAVIYSYVLKNLRLFAKLFIFSAYLSHFLHSD